MCVCMHLLYLNRIFSVAISDYLNLTFLSFIFSFSLSPFPLSVSLLSVSVSFNTHNIQV